MRGRLGQHTRVWTSDIQHWICKLLKFKCEPINDDVMKTYFYVYVVLWLYVSLMWLYVVVFFVASFIIILRG